MRVELERNEYVFMVWMFIVVAFGITALVGSWVVLKYEDYKLVKENYCSEGNTTEGENHE